MRGLRLLFSLLRLGFAAWLLLTCWQYLPNATAWREFAALPDFDYAAEARLLRDKKQYSESLLVIDAGVHAAPSPQQAALLQLRVEVEAERDSLLRRLQEAGAGALSGRGESVEALAGAVTADLFVFGDVRDLVIEGGKALRGEDNDEVIVALSAAGIVLTVAPTLDIGAALLKFARRVGALSDAFARQLLHLARSAVTDRTLGPLGEVVSDTATLARSSGPAVAVSILKHVDDSAALRSAARFAGQPGGAFALWLGGRPALDWLVGSGAEGGALLLRAARKGREGIAFLGTRGALLLQPHPLLGLFKGLYKGNVPALLAEFVQRQALAVLGLAAGWLLFEILLLLARLRPSPKV